MISSNNLQSQSVVKSKRPIVVHRDKQLKRKVSSSSTISPLVLQSTLGAGVILVLLITAKMHYPTLAFEFFLALALVTVLLPIVVMLYVNWQQSVEERDQRMRYAYANHDLTRPLQQVRVERQEVGKVIHLP